VCVYLYEYGPTEAFVTKCFKCLEAARGAMQINTVCREIICAAAFELQAY